MTRIVVVSKVVASSLRGPDLHSVPRPAASLCVTRSHHDFSLNSVACSIRRCVRLDTVWCVRNSRLQLALLFFLSCRWHCSFTSWVLGSHPWLFFLYFTSVRSVFFCSHLPSPVAIGSLFRATSTRCILLLLPLSWLTDSLAHLSHLIGCDFSGYFFRAPGTRCRLLLLLPLWGRFFVSARCASPRSLASSDLTATFRSSMSSSRHSRASSCATSCLFCSSSSILW